MTTLTLPRRTARTSPAPAVTGDCRVIVADDHPLYREGIVRALLAHGGFDVVAETADGAEALRLIRELQPDLALLDVACPASTASTSCTRSRCTGRTSRS